MSANALEHEIAMLGIPFGLIENMVLSKKSNQVSLDVDSDLFRL